MVERHPRYPLVFVQVAEHGRGDGVGIAVAESLEEDGVGSFTAPLLLGPVVQSGERQPDIAFGRVPQTLQRPQVPGGGGRLEQFEVERVVSFVDLVDSEVLVAEHRDIGLEALEVGPAQQRAGPTGDLQLQPAPEPIDATKVLGVQRSDGRASSGVRHDQSLRFELPEGLTDRDEANPELAGDLSERT
ncbi:hypothetical protein ORV05_08095 [Amycolatopsis cynarae]|uniref:Uncharacterized protein n=1 Tax=Amycolatopsis cynarae TaxID=2995223 RepID=A0ABY7B5Z1_9PSEU|nr:hypothetical protein [Amycolatopsis sp. HUAS 11-8]WAL67725.1 hypothetical protein ORV05_08095 [Amycolatopsis sp. HUAS 11-8]